MRWTLALGLLGFALACGCDSSPSAARELRPELEPLLDEHARYDRWARRLSLGNSAFRSPEALYEAAFAPLRGRSQVLAAWLEREGPDATDLRYPEGLPAAPTDGWVRVVTDHELGEVHGQRTSLSLGGEAQTVLLIRRSRPAPGGATLHVTLAFPAAN